jgi:hypothetical protein
MRKTMAVAMVILRGLSHHGASIRELVEAGGPTAFTATPRNTKTISAETIRFEEINDKPHAVNA